eukprot:GHVS01073539.1.p1 GENE.GHVS01073539.1~~GHVS01073539.1.p1  ORF type:complete len:815 (-),score=52.20 GHVS01073539.1:142-2586(-)
MVSSSNVGGAFLLSLKAIGTIAFLWSAGMLFGLLPRRNPIVQEYSNKALALVVVNLAVPMSAFVSLCTMSPSAFLWELPLAGTVFLALSYSIAYAIIRLGDLLNIFAVCNPSAVAMIIVVCSWEATAFALALMIPVCSDRCSYVAKDAGVASIVDGCVNQCKTKLTGMIVLFFTPWRLAYPLTKLLYINELRRRAVVQTPGWCIERTRKMERQICSICRGGSRARSLSAQRERGFAMQQPWARREAEKTADEKAPTPPLRVVRWSEDVMPTTKSMDSDIGRRARSWRSRQSSEESGHQWESQQTRGSEIGARASMFRLVSDKHAGEDFEREVDLLWNSSHNLDVPKHSPSRRQSTMPSRLASILHTSDDGEHHGAQASQARKAMSPLKFLNSHEADVRSSVKSRAVSCPSDVRSSEPQRGPTDIMSNSGSTDKREADIEAERGVDTPVNFQIEPSPMSPLPSSKSITAAEAVESQTEDETTEGSPAGLELPTVVLCPCADQPSRQFPVNAPSVKWFDGLSASRVDPDVTTSRDEDDPAMESHDTGPRDLSWSSMHVDEGGALYPQQDTHAYLWRSSTQDLSNVPENDQEAKNAGRIQSIQDTINRLWSSVPFSNEIYVACSFTRLVVSNTIIATVLGLCLLSWNSLSDLMFSPSGALGWLGEVFTSWSSLVVPLQGIITGSHLTRIIRSYYGDVAPDEAVRRMPWVVIFTVSVSRMVLLPALGIVFVSYILPRCVANKTLCELSNGDPAALGLVLTMALVCPPGEAVLVFSGFNPGDLHLYVLPCCLVAILFMMTWSVISLVHIGYYDPVTACQ